VKILNWNIAWNSENKRKIEIIKTVIRSKDPDVICITDGNSTLKIEGYPHVISSEKDYGYKHDGTRRKVLLFSKYPFGPMNPCGIVTDPPGRFISGSIKYNNSEYLIIGMCVPLKSAHVNTGNKNRKVWEDHSTFLNQLKDIIEKSSKYANVIVMGDFNQTIPHTNQPEAVYNLLMEMFTEFKMATEHMNATDDSYLVDHIIISKNLNSAKPVVLKNKHENIELSDHSGYFVELEDVV
jgi:exonuclease III